MNWVWTVVLILFWILLIRPFTRLMNEYVEDKVFAMWLGAFWPMTVPVGLLAIGSVRLYLKIVELLNRK